MRQTFEVGQRVTVAMETRGLTANTLYKIVARHEIEVSDGKPFFTYDVVDSTGKRVFVCNGHLAFKAFTR